MLNTSLVNLQQIHSGQKALPCVKCALYPYAKISKKYKYFLLIKQRQQNVMFIIFSFDPNIAGFRQT